MKDFFIHTSWNDPATAVVTVKGEFDLARIPYLEEMVSPLVAKKTAHLILDLNQMTFIDSSAFGVLVSLVRQIRPYGGRLAVVAKNQQFLQLLGTLRLEPLFPIFRSLSEALEPDLFPQNLRQEKRELASSALR